MSRAALLRLLAVQTVLLVLAVWAGVYFARDEFLLATARHQADDDEGLSRPPSAVEEDGVPTVRLSEAAQHNVGLELAMPTPAELGADQPVPVVVLDPQPLAELQGRLRAARHELDAARAQAASSAKEHARVRALFEDDRNASERAVEAAAAQAAADRGREQVALAALAALREGATATWGAALARDLEAEGRGAAARFASGREALLRVQLRADDPVPAEPRLLITLAGRATPLTARPMGAGAAGAAGDGGWGRSLVFRVEGGGLLPGQRLSGRLLGGATAPEPGVTVPAAAVIWHAGQPWIYIQETNEPQAVSRSPRAAAPPAAVARAASGGSDDDDDDRAAPGAASAAGAAPARTAAQLPAFQRRAVPYARRVGDGWFLPGYAEDDLVVVRGAQVLLSEELKFQIRNENDD